MRGLVIGTILFSAALAADLDPSNVAPADGAGTGINDVDSVAQTLTFDGAGTLTTLRIGVRKFANTTDDLRIDVLTLTPAGVPDVVLGSLTVPVQQVALGEDPFALTLVDLAPLGIAVQPGDRLAIAAQSTGPDVFNVALTQDTAGTTGRDLPAYAGGALFQLVNGQWQPFENFTAYDTRFQVFVTADPDGLDQQNVRPSTAGTAFGNESLAQVVTVGRDGYLDAVDFAVRRFETTPGSVRLRVLDAPNGVPTANVLAEATIANGDIPLATEPFTRFEILGGLAVSAGQQIALAVDSPDWAAGGGVFPVALTDDTDYAGGDLFLDFPGSNGWQVFQGRDTRFRTFLDIADRPEGLDQQNIAPTNAGTAFGTESLAQVVTVGRDGNLDAVNFAVRRFETTPGSVRLQVLAAPNGTPTATVLAEVTVANADIPLAVEDFTRFEIPGGLAVSAGQRIALSVDSPDWAPGGGVFPVALTAETEYDGGDLWLDFPGSNGWQRFQGRDTRFQTFLDIAPRPLGLDQANTVETNAGTAFGAESLAQVITVGRDGSLDAVDFAVRRFANTPGDVRLRVMGVQNGEPNADVLAEVTVLNADVPLATEPFTRFVLPDGLPVVAGQQLTLAVDSPNWAPGGSVFPVAVTDDTAYAGGQFFQTLPNDPDFFLFQGRDARFRTFLDLPDAAGADAGPDFTVAVGDVAGPSARRSASEGATSYAWRVDSAPAGSAFTLAEINAVRPRLTADVEGEYVLTVAVANGGGGGEDSVLVVAVNENDACPKDPNKDAPGTCGCGVADEDTDGDGTLDCDDACPADPNKTAPGLCDCGTADDDTDGDTVADCVDGCAADPAKTAPGVCGCGASDVDSDGDGTADCDDACAADPAKTNPGVCGCGASDADSDGDGTADCDDACPADPAKTNPGVCGCGVADDDGDGDGALDCDDACPADPAKTNPGVCGCGASDADSDGDGTADCDDACPADPAKTNPGVCGCGASDADSDGDGTADCDDACPADPAKTNPGVCGCGASDADSDGDGVADCVDACPFDATQPDDDGDGCPDDAGGVDDIAESTAFEITPLQAEAEVLAAQSGNRQVEEAAGALADAIGLLGADPAPGFPAYDEAVRLQRHAVQQLAIAELRGVDVGPLPADIAGAVDDAVAAWLLVAQTVDPGDRAVARAAAYLDDARAHLADGDFVEALRAYKKASNQLDRVL